MWLPNPPAGEGICAGFDGSLNDDWTVIRAESREGFQFTPRYGPDRRPTIWNPAEWGGVIPRGEVRVAWAELVERYDLRRAYCDPGFHDETSWETEIEDWDVTFGPASTGEPRFVEWPTTSFQRMYPAIRRFESDLPSLITNDGCPITSGHMRNTKKIPVRRGYVLGKTAHHQKIDAGVTSVLAHEAASDERAAGWADKTDTRVFCFT